MRPIFLITVTLLFSHQFIAACKKNKLEPDGVEQLFGRLQSNGSSKSKETTPPPDNYSDLPLKLESGTMSTLNWSTAAQCKNPGSVYGVANKEVTIPFEYRTCLPQQQYSTITVTTSLVKTTQLFGMLATYSESGKTLFLNIMLTIMPDGLIFMSCEGTPTDNPADKITGSMLSMKSSLESTLSQAQCNNHVYFLDKEDPSQLIVIFPSGRQAKTTLKRLN